MTTYYSALGALHYLCAIISSVACRLFYSIMFVLLYHSLAGVTMCYGWFVAKQVLHLTGSLLITSKLRAMFYYLFL